MNSSKFRTAYDLYSNEAYPILYTGCSYINRTTKGIPTKCITEIYGEARSGKTQFALQLVVKAQDSLENGGLEGGVVYITAHKQFPIKRLHQLLKKFPVAGRKVITDNLFLYHAKNFDHLKQCVNVNLPLLLASIKIKLIVIDSITTLFFADESENYISRARDLQFFATILKKLSVQYELAVLFINQITSDPELGCRPCLGLAWTNEISRRIEFACTGQSVIMDDNTIQFPRILKVTFAPDVPPNECLFFITDVGLIGIAIHIVENDDEELSD